MPSKLYLSININSKNDVNSCFANWRNNQFQKSFKLELRVEFSRVH